MPLARDREELQRNVDESLAGVEDVAGTKAATLSILVRAASQQERADFASAQASYREFLDAAGDGHELAFLAREGLALALEAAGDTDAALAELEKLTGSEGDFYRDQALWQRARLLEQLGRTDEALALYRQYIVEFPLAEKSMARAEVKEHLGKLDPTAIPPEPPPGMGGLQGLVPP
ncbi:MAG: tetratricopeptide repeat protein [Deltaproteobacteria bacterium]|nr:tetratricopeptide repeat protein [Nannocystaceae bacterium]